MDITVRDDRPRARYEAWTPGGSLAGFAAYQLVGDLAVMTHTEVDPAYEAQGVGSALVRGALDDLREHGLRVRPLCPFVSAFIGRHPEYADLVASA